MPPNLKSPVAFAHGSDRAATVREPVPLFLRASLLSTHSHLIARTFDLTLVLRYFTQDMSVNQAAGTCVPGPYRSLTVPCYPNSAFLGNPGWYSQVLQYQNGTKARFAVRYPFAMSRATRWRSALYRGFYVELEPLRSADPGSSERSSGFSTKARRCFVGGSPAPGASAVQAALPGFEGDRRANQRGQGRLGCGTQV
jgi:hypothetical protein